MGDWWYRNIVEPGKLPLLLALAAFLLTFAATRTVTRLIRAGRGPFRNVTPGGMHIHHVVPGVILTVIGGFGAVGSGRHGFGASICAVIFGIGAGLVLDEFALILHLADVYWTEQGRQSVEVVVLAAALGLLVLSGFSPLGVNDVTGQEEQGRGTAILTVLINLLFVVLAMFKGSPGSRSSAYSCRSSRCSGPSGSRGPDRRGPSAGTGGAPRPGPDRGCAPTGTTGAGRS